MDKSPLVSVIIVNWNGGTIFANCLRSLSKINYPKWELIVIDNGSTDGSEKITKSQVNNHNLQIIINKQNLGFAKANNQGLDLVRGEYVLLLNNDTKVESNFLTKMVARMESDHSLGVVQPKILLMDKKGYLDNAGSFMTKIGFLHHWGFMQKDGPEYEKEKEIFSAKGACMLIKKEVTKKTGLFDEDFFSYFEESDFCWRVWLLGYRVLYFPQAKIYHKLGFTIKRLDVLNLNYHYYKNRICSLVKNTGTENLLPIITSHLIISLGIMVLFLIRLHPRNSLLIARAILWNLIHLPQSIKKRTLIQKYRLRTDQQIFANTLYPINFQKYFQDFKRVEKDLK